MLASASPPNRGPPSSSEPRLAQEVVHVGLKEPLELSAEMKSAGPNPTRGFPRGHVGQVDAETGGTVCRLPSCRLDADVGLRAAGGDEGVIFPHAASRIRGGRAKGDRRFGAQRPTRARRRNVESNAVPKGHGETKPAAASTQRPSCTRPNLDPKGKSMSTQGCSRRRGTRPVTSRPRRSPSPPRVAVKACWVSAGAHPLGMGRIEEHGVTDGHVGHAHPPSCTSPKGRWCGRAALGGFDEDVAEPVGVGPRRLAAPWRPHGRKGFPFRFIPVRESIPLEVGPVVLNAVRKKFGRSLGAKVIGRVQGKAAGRPSASLGFHEGHAVTA
ncbi:MAG: hypothetical protein CM15mP18_1090 [Methanobacteriota archaeon]|nr:MAG: hypothetical protein CM15mP18_1090 [Euryarchaeota archaeon]